MGSEQTLNIPSADLQIIQQVINHTDRNGVNRPRPEDLVNALLNVETTIKKQRINYNLQDFMGKWRLCFATGTRKARQRGGILLGKGFYLPKFIPAYITFTASNEMLNQGEMTNQIELAGIRFKFTGLINYLGKKNLLAFNTYQIEIFLLNRIIYRGRLGKKNLPEFQDDFYQTSIAKLPFFAFFLATNDLMAARGRGGGLAVWVKEK